MKVALCCLAALVFACQEQQPRLKVRDDACTKNRDCTYGLECVEGGTLADGGVVKSGKTCQFHSFGECEGDGMQPGPDRQPQCLNTYRCREGKCTVQCAGHADCKKDEVCRVGVCQKGNNTKAQCFDNRDCSYPETCYYGQCVKGAISQRCNSDLDCGPGSRCINAVCQ